MKQNRCVCCGRILPEGLEVCYDCEQDTYERCSKTSKHKQRTNRKFKERKFR